MTTKLAVLVVHGMGTQKENDFHQCVDGMQRAFNEEWRTLSVDPGQIKWERGYWGDILQVHETELLEKKLGQSRLDWIKLRHFVVDNLGDVVAYQRVPGSEKSFYCQIHNRIGRQIRELRAQLEDESTPFCVIAHSLGAYIMSDHIWDRQSAKSKGRPDPLGQTPFERLESLASIISFGCNIAVLSLALDPYVGISFPPATLPAELAAKARWLNLYDPDDVLGYPVKPLCPEYTANDHIEDRCINVGGIFTSWNPFCHDHYWEDPDLIKPAARQLAEIVNRS